jgi:hypothetical protein
VEVIDLAKFANGLPEGFEDVQKIIKRTLDLNSSRSDLRIATDLSSHALEFIREPPPAEPKLYEDVILALTSSAVVYYARATKSSSDHRRTFDLRSHFDGSEKESHDLLCKLRDDAIAHYGPGELPDAVQLRSDHLLVSQHGQIVAVSRHTYGTDQLAEMTFRQAQRATLIMQRLFHREEALLVETLNRLASEPSAEPAKQAALIELGAAIGDEKVASQILDGPRVGHRRVHRDGPA